MKTPLFSILAGAGGGSFSSNLVRLTAVQSHSSFSMKRGQVGFEAAADTAAVGYAAYMYAMPVK